MNTEKYISVPNIQFSNRKRIDWDEVREYLRNYQGNEYMIIESGDIIKINMMSVDEYVSSQYTRGLKGTLAKAKANVAQILPKIIENAVNKRWVANNDVKHENNASKGWYRYDSYFALPVKATNEDYTRWNNYRCTIVVRANDKGLFLYDIINIKKEVSNPR